MYTWYFFDVKAIISLFWDSWTSVRSVSPKGDSLHTSTITYLLIFRPVTTLDYRNINLSQELDCLAWIFNPSILSHCLLKRKFSKFLSFFNIRNFSWKYVHVRFFGFGNDIAFIDLILFILAFLDLIFIVLNFEQKFNFPFFNKNLLFVFLQNFNVRWRFSSICLIMFFW